MQNDFKAIPLWASILAHRSDAALFVKALEGDQKAARQLVSYLGPKAHALAWRILGDANESQDIVQAALFKLFETKQYDGKSSLSTYFHVIVTRLCFDRLRAHGSSKLDYGVNADEFILDESQNPIEYLEKKQFQSNVQHAMMFLNPRQRAALALWAYQDATIPEIAHSTGIDLNAAHQLLHRAKSNLRKKMEELGYDQ